MKLTEPDGTLNQEQKIIKKVKTLDFKTIFNALYCLTDSGYRLTKEEKSTVGRLKTIQKYILTTKEGKESEV